MMEMRGGNGGGSLELSAKQKRQMYEDIDAVAKDSMAAFDDQLSGSLPLDLASSQSNAEFNQQLQDDVDRGLARMDRGAYAAQQSRMLARDIDESIRSNDLSGSLNRTVANMRSLQFEVEPETAAPEPCRWDMTSTG